MFTFHNAIILANVLKDVIKKDDAKLTWFDYFRKQTGMLNHSVSRYIRQGTTRFRSMSLKGNALFKRQLSRGMSMRRDSDDEDDEDDDGSFKRTKSVDGSIKRTRSLKLNRSFSRTFSKNSKSFSKSMSRSTRYAARKFNNTIAGLVRSRFFRYCELILISVNFVILCCYTADMTQAMLTRIRILLNLFIILWLF